MVSDEPLTRETILALAPGPELDALVAEKVMGWRLSEYNAVCRVTSGHGEPCWIREDDVDEVDGISPSCWCPSTDIAVAWEVVEKFPFFSTRCGTMDEIYAPSCRATASPTAHRLEGIADMCGTSEWVTARMMPEAICKAALLAVLEEAAK